MKNFLQLSFLFTILIFNGSIHSQTYWGTDITSNTTWTLSMSPIILTNDINIIGNSTLSIQSGVVIEFDIFGIEVQTGSSLNAAAAIFNNGYYHGIIVEGNCNIQGSTFNIMYLYFDQGNCTIQNSIFYNTEIQVDDTTLIDGNTFNLSSLIIRDSSSSIIIANNNFDSPGSFLGETISFRGDLPNPTITGNTFFTDCKITLRSCGVYSGSRILKKYQNLPYVIQSAFGFFIQNSFVTIETGLEIYFSGGNIDILQGGTLNAIGVTFSSLEVNYINTEGFCNIQNSIFNNVGIYFSSISGGGDGTIKYSDFLVPTNRFGILNNGTNTIDAENNYWNGNLGPQHPSNPSGNGCQVSDNVDFIPFATEPINFIYYDLSVKINPAYNFYGWEFYQHFDPEGGPIPQNQISFEVEISSNIHYDPPLQDIEVSVLLNEQPMNLIFETSVTDLDIDGDGKIDQFPSDRFPNWDYIKFLAVSNDVYTNNQIGKNITVKILSINGQPINITMQEVIDYYFAKKQDNEPFREDVDGYGFDNGDTPFSYVDFYYYIRQAYGILPVSLITFLWDYYDGGRAMCYGFSASSGTYFVDPSRKPLSGNVYDFPINNPIVIDNINRAHLSQDFVKLVVGFQELNVAYDFTKNELAEHKPALIGFGEPGFFGSKHAVLATSLLHFQNQNIASIRIYENTFHNEGWSSIMDFNQQKFIHPAMPNWNKVLSLPSSIYSLWDIQSYLFQALDIIIQEFYNIGKKGYSTACPVYLLIKNSSNQKSGYTSEGTLINEIPDAEIKRISMNDTNEDSLTIIYVPKSDNYTVEINAYNNGQMLFETMNPETANTLTTSSFDSVDVTNQMICYYNDAEPSNLQIDVDGDGDIDTTIVVVVQIITGIEDDKVIKNHIPSQFELIQNYPNPFNPSTKIKYSVPQSSNVLIKVFDILGNEVETLVNEEKPAGTYEVTWYPENIPSGIYFYQLNAGSFVQTNKMILLK